MINVKFFARLRDQLGQSTSTLPADNIQCVADVRAALLNLYPDWQSYLVNNNLLVAVNQTMGSNDSPVQDNDEVAFFPPVTGG